MKTAEEVWNDYHFNYVGEENSLLEAMREFAKLHVKAALEAASEIKIKGQYSSQMFSRVVDDKKSILKAYPEDLIK